MYTLYRQTVCIASVMIQNTLKIIQQKPKYTQKLIAFLSHMRQDYYIEKLYMDTCVKVCTYTCICISTDPIL